MFQIQKKSKASSSGKNKENISKKGKHQVILCHGIFNAA